MNEELPSFDEMMRMAQEEPEKLAQLQRNVSAQAVQSAPEEYRGRMRGILFHTQNICDLKRDNYQGRCVYMFQAMNKSWDRFPHVVQYGVPDPKDLPSASVLNFERKDPD